MAGVELKPQAQWGQKLEQTELEAKSSGALDGEKPVHAVRPVHEEKGEVHDVQHVQASGHLSAHSAQPITEELLSEVVQGLRPILPRLKLRDPEEVVEYLAATYGRELAEKVLEHLKPRL